jgi:hypothetical protein
MINKHIGFYEKDNSQRKAEIDVSKLGSDVIKSLVDASSRSNSTLHPINLRKELFRRQDFSFIKLDKARAGTIHTYEEYYRGVSL